jgi:hypothetical protein
MRRWTTGSLALAAVLLLASGAAAADDAAKKLQGTWNRSVGNQKVTFSFKADSMSVLITDGNNTLKVQCEYGVTKDGNMLYGIITNVEGNGPNKGDPFSFHIKVEKDTLTLDEMKGTDSPEAKQLIQGDYKKQ